MYVDLVEYARVQDINFSSAKKMKADLDEKISNISEFPKKNVWRQIWPVTKIHLLYLKTVLIKAEPGVNLESKLATHSQ